ncbi:MAG: hypothetical protein J6I50_00385 [Clostridia bacterium]|nr:hypothetical protein [Clostridia bacterium]
MPPHWFYIKVNSKNHRANICVQMIAERTELLRMKVVVWKSPRMLVPFLKRFFHIGKESD